MAEIPSYIHICGRRNPKLDDCIIDSIEQFRDELLSGIPELDVPPLSPLILENVIFIDQPNIYIEAKKVIIQGLNTYKTLNLKTDLEKQQINTTIFYRHLFMKANYDVNTKILVTIADQGKLTADINNATAKVSLRYKLIEKDNKKYMYFFSMTTKLDFKDIALDIQPENISDTTITEAFKNVFGNNKKDIISVILPSLEKSISENVLKISNNVVKHFHYDELLPDKE
ncbi:putative beta-carotene-binding protein [Vespula squamosa]|uniref:Beta-carotene-binding protein n=1 Tax=Vespula squamosa TaxID=30214 RepID=A0ABD2BAB9_VESSQ